MGYKILTCRFGLYSVKRFDTLEAAKKAFRSLYRYYVEEGDAEIWLMPDDGSGGFIDYERF